MICSPVKSIWDVANFTNDSKLFLNPYANIFVPHLDNYGTYPRDRKNRDIWLTPKEESTNNFALDSEHNVIFVPQTDLRSALYFSGLNESGSFNAMSPNSSVNHLPPEPSDSLKCDQEKPSKLKFSTFKSAENAMSTSHPDSIDTSRLTKLNPLATPFIWSGHKRQISHNLEITNKINALGMKK